MTNTDRPYGPGTADRAVDAGRRRSDVLVSEGVVASYLHEMSRRHARPRRSTGDPVVLAVERDERGLRRASARGRARRRVAA